ncbi:hypothetical protein AMATHDRAFT_141465 [Amanita thiersii Skay4041]|uniref:Oxo-4-hydroxy-4-carboxy-5-ureidoimidazoline decarboxylase domain-containing protein n=1 Tax=Amanita thiersii Skay4041 TaxID=703135 RepID=A0A2A9NW50_9AGAR|nr:hypothetical protein AMATHDRAFT_141465 [Amanita thiersii Skay4041]
MTTLPALENVYKSTSDPDSHLATALTILFEHSHILLSVLTPQLAKAFKEGLSISSYRDLIDVALNHITTWDIDSQARFISGHPRIGENKNLSALSTNEQAAQATPPEVLGRLAHLNACYEKVYPGLRYITFVNGRSRTAIVEEMEDVLNFEHSMSPNQPALEELETVSFGSDVWRSELNRAVGDVGRIGKSRLVTLGVQ